MLAIDIMTPAVITASPETSVAELCRLMLESRISALPIVDKQGVLVGLITEGDLLRRYESGTDKRRSRWAEMFVSDATLAAEYVKSHGRTAKDLMTPDVFTVDESTSLRSIADMFEARGIKRVPVLREKRLVGMVSRANLLQALVASEQAAGAAPADDATIRTKLLAEFADKPWRPSNVIVRQGVAHLWGEVTSEEERAAMRVAAENTPGVKKVKDHTVYPTVWPPFG